MKYSLIVAIALSFGVFFPPWGECQDNCPKSEQKCLDKRGITISGEIEASGNHQGHNTRENESRPGNEASQWALVIVGLITFIVVAWQAYETRRAADVANANLKSIKTKERAKIVFNIEPWHKPYYPSMPTSPQVLMSVYNIGETKASILLAVAGIHLSTSKAIENQGSGYFPLNIDKKVMDSNERSQEAIQWAGGNWSEYLSKIVYQDQIVHLHGTIIFEDAFGDKWERKFHYIWNDYGIVVNSPPRGYIRGDWVSQIEEHETLVRPAKEPNRAIQTVRYIWGKWVELSKEDYP